MDKQLKRIFYEKVYKSVISVSCLVFFSDFVVVEDGSFSKLDLALASINKDQKVRQCGNGK